MSSGIKAVLAERMGFPEAMIHEDAEKSLLANQDYLTLVLTRK